jgi:hypothetical protein
MTQLVAIHYFFARGLQENADELRGFDGRRDEGNIT